MSRIAKAPVDVVSGVEVSISGQEVTVKGSKGTLTRVFNDAVEVAQEENQLKALPREGFVDGWAQAGTARSILNAMVQGVSEGFEKMPSVEQGTVKRLGEIAEKSKSTVTIISTDSEEGISLQKAFGGLAAMLRYPIS